MSTLHTLSVLVEDRPGVLTRVAGLFAARGYNIVSLAVGPTEEPGLSRMTIVVDADRKPLEQVTKQLNKLINVIKIVEHVTHRTLTIEATGSPAKLESFLRLLDDFGVVELARTGRIALLRGDRGIRERVLKSARAAGDGAAEAWDGGGV